jgi:hypothetical protein
MRGIEEFIVTAFCLVLMVIALLKVLAIEFEDLKKRWRK